MQDLTTRLWIEAGIAARRIAARARGEEGQTTTEYAILLGFLAIAIIVAIYFLRNVIRQLFSDSAESVQDAPS